jgi:2-dehydropantoate 2-reductase
MKIAVIGSGAMGMLFGGYLSKGNEVVLLDTDKIKVDTINKTGIRIQEPDGNVTAAAPKATLSAEEVGEVDLILLFVKAMDSKSALRANRRLIGPNTYVLSLQNGSGHDAAMKESVAENRIAIGTTQHNSSIIEAGLIHHGGGGKTYIGPLSGNGRRLKPIEGALTKCGIETQIIDNIRRKIWEKLFINASASALTAILRTNLGFIVENSSAWALARQLVKEAVAVANREGMGFEEEKVLDELQRLLKQARNGYTSIYADIRDGRKTEADFISGAVVAAGMRANVPTPGHELVLGLIHALEDRNPLNP